MEQQLVWALVGTALCYGVRRRTWNAKLLARGMACVLAGLVLLQSALALAGGASLLQNILPLHLCSATALITIPMLWRWDENLFQFSWYLGMPGALLALLIPVVGYSPWPGLMRSVFLASHAMLAIAPIFMRSAGATPKRYGVWLVLLSGNGLLLLALLANGMFGANYLFLAQPPENTPLAWMARHGTLGLIAWLEGIVLVLMRVMSRAAVGEGRDGLRRPTFLKKSWIKKLYKNPF